MKKIYFILPPYLPFPPVRGGAVESLLDLFVEENEKKGRYDVTVFSIFDETAETVARKYKYTKMVYFRKKDKTAEKKKLCDLVQKFTMLRINALDDYNASIISYIRSHDLPDLCIVEGGNYREYSNISKIVGRERMVLHVHAVSTPRFDSTNIFQSFIFVSDCAMRYWNRKRQCNGFVVKNAVNENLFQEKITEEQRSVLRKKYGITDNDFLLLFCGRLVEGKGILELIKAVKQLNCPTVKLLVIGSSNFEGASITPYQQELLSFLDDQTIFTGYINNQELSQYYQMADLVVSPSIFVEGAPLVNIEAMMCGRPVVTTSQGGIPEYANSSGVAMIDYQDDREKLTEDICVTISQLIKDSDQLSKMGSKNAEYAKIFTKEMYFENYSCVIDKLISGDKNQ